MKLYYLAFRGDRQVQQLSQERKKKEKTKLENTSVQARSDSKLLSHFGMLWAIKVQHLHMSPKG